MSDMATERDDPTLAEMVDHFEEAVRLHGDDPAPACVEMMPDELAIVAAALRAANEPSGVVFSFTCPHCGEPWASTTETRHINIHAGAVYQCAECCAGVTFTAVVAGPDGGTQP